MASPNDTTEISQSYLEASVPDGTAKITRVHQLASYNWAEKEQPTIIVPGSPALWSPPSVPNTKLTPDAGVRIIDEDGYKNPAFPLESLFRALYAEKPDFDIRQVNLVTNRNNLRKLLSFVQAFKANPFKIRVEIVGDTALFDRVDKYAEVIKGNQGYGHNFERAYTKTEPGMRASHHRIVGYEFGGMRCIVRHETDGYVASDHDPLKPDGHSSPAPEGTRVNHEPASTSTPPLSSSFPPGATSSEATTAQTGGKQVDISTTLEIKTRSMKNQLDMREVFPQLWISQTPKLVTAFHNQGFFSIVSLQQDMTDKIRNWEETNQEDLRKLACLIKKIINVVKETADKKALVVYEKVNGVASFRIDPGEGRAVLPEDLYKRWEDKEQEEADDQEETPVAEDGSREAGQADEKGEVQQSTEEAPPVRRGRGRPRRSDTAMPAKSVRKEEATGTPGSRRSFRVRGEEPGGDSPAQARRKRRKV